MWYLERGESIQLFRRNRSCCSFRHSWCSRWHSWCSLWHSWCSLWHSVWRRSGLIGWTGKANPECWLRTAALCDNSLALKSTLVREAYWSHVQCPIITSIYSRGHTNRASFLNKFEPLVNVDTSMPLLFLKFLYNSTRYPFNNSMQCSPI